MKKNSISFLMVSLVVLCIAARVAVAQDKKFEVTSLSVELLPVASEGVSIAPSYGWKSEWPKVVIRGKGFGEWHGSGNWITNHSVGLAPKGAQWVQLTTEHGATSNGSYSQIAVALDLVDSPLVPVQLQQVLSELSFAQYKRVAGPGPGGELQVSWETQKATFGKIQIAETGFCRLRLKRGDFCRTYIEFSGVGHKRLTFELELEQIGKIKNAGIGFKLTIK